jgi:lipoprotein NlpI
MFRLISKRDTKRIKVLEFIENNAKKSSFVNWLNTQYDVAFSEKSDWDELKDTLLEKEKKKVKTKDLQLYASSLSSEDLKNLLEDVEEETKKAKHVASKLFYLSRFKKFSIAIGGAVLLEGLIFLALGIALFLKILGVDMPEGIRLSIFILALILGTTNLIGGLLLSSS